MLSLRKPSSDALRRFLVTQVNLPFTYEAVGATAETPPAGHVVDRTRINLGQGKAVFRSAIAALRRWEQFNLGWVEAWPSDTPIQKGVDETGPVSRFGFAYGTLPGHVESGEERFLIEWDQRDGGVWYDILAFSRPHQFPARVGYPMVRQLQKRFGRDSAASMLKAANASGGKHAG